MFLKERTIMTLSGIFETMQMQETKAKTMQTDEENE